MTCRIVCLYIVLLCSAVQLEIWIDGGSDRPQFYPLIGLSTFDSQLLSFKTIEHRHDGALVSMCMSADGSQIATCCDDKQVSLLDITEDGASMTFNTIATRFTVRAATHSENMG